MRVYIKTPFYKNNKYLSHLLEHCVLFSDKISDFLYIYKDIEAYTSTGYTVFEFNNFLWWKSVVKRIQQSIIPHNIDLQKNIIKYEYEDGWTYGQKLYEKVLQKVMKNKKIATTTIPKISNEEIESYHKQWYQEKNMLIFDEESKTILNRWLGKKAKKDPKIIKKHLIEYSTIAYQKDNYDLIFTRYHSPYDILFLDFFESLVNASICYNTTINWAFYEDLIDISLTNDMYILTIDKGTLPKKISKDFFLAFKKYFIEEIGNGKMRSFIPNILMFTGYFISIDQHQKYIETIEIKSIEDVLSLVV